jgi:hypothetical protein
MEHDLAKLKKLSDGEVHLMSYPELKWEEWSDNTSFLKSSQAPKFIKDILIHKHKRRTHLFFGEAYVAAQLSNTTEEGWFNSWDWISSYNWIEGRYSRSSDLTINNLKRKFYEDALDKYIGKENFSVLLKVQENFSQKPEPPDLWLIDEQRRHHFIEVKKDDDTLSEAQMLGLALIYVCLRSQIHLLWLYEESKSPPSNQKFSEYIMVFKRFKESIEAL